MARALVLRPSAKINLMLRIGQRQPDGYHDLRTLMQSIGISDTLTLTARRGPFALQTRAPGVPSDATNLVWRAADALWQSAGRTDAPRDVHVKLDKGIPSAAGLGGGSADAAAALVGLNAVWDLHRPRKELMRIAATLGADVPFFLQCGTALCVGRGDEVYPVDDAARLGIVVIKPSFGVSTAEAYRWLDEDRQVGEASVAGREPREADIGWSTGPVLFANDLEAPVARRHPAILEMIDACIGAGALAAAMSGSGSAVYGVFPESVATRAAKRLNRPDWLVLLTRTVTRQEAGRRIRL
jgi:4-diphosphocytidyl-2-C-methyl-D-erythritol kinase